MKRKKDGIIQKNPALGTRIRWLPIFPLNTPGKVYEM
jgi:hypothetical protein